jgi:hypothetical protein
MRRSMPPRRPEPGGVLSSYLVVVPYAGRTTGSRDVGPRHRYVSMAYVDYV